MSTQRLPDALLALVEQLSRLPGLGPKSALRCAMSLLKWPEAETRRLGQNIFELRDKLRLCSQCRALTDVEPCAICADTKRQKEILCLVADWDSMLALEAGAFYHGQYLILGGLLSPLEHISPENLELSHLYNRLASEQIEELVLALGATVEADNTASFISLKLRKAYPHLRITRLAQGIPLGAEVKFMDQETLRQSLQHRQEL